MSDIVNKAVEELSAKIEGDFDGSAKFVIGDEGAVIIDSSGVRASDDDAEVTLTADVETFQSILSGDLNPTAAYMSGQLSVEGDISVAMKLGAVLS